MHSPAGAHACISTHLHIPMSPCLFVSLHFDLPPALLALPTLLDRRLVYLSSDAEQALSAEEAADASTVLIIGGLVDHAAGHAGGSRVGAALRVADQVHVRACRLPIEPYVTVRKPSLTCTAVVQILAGVAATGDWGSAVREAPAMRCAPLRKYVRWTNAEAAPAPADPQMEAQEGPSHEVLDE